MRRQIGSQTADAAVEQFQGEFHVGLSFRVGLKSLGISKIPGIDQIVIDVIFITESLIFRMQPVLAPSCAVLPPARRWRRAH
jgi:hypothetical protein